MNTRMIGWTRGLAVMLAVSILAPAAAAKERFSLVSAVPDDVFLCVAGRHNVERAFLDDYWSEVFGALKQSGIGSDIMELIGSQMGDEQLAEVDHLKELAKQLLEGVDWDKLGGGEIVFAERMNEPVRIGGSITMVPDMIWLVHGQNGSTPKNYQGLVAILQTITAEINKAAGKELMTVDMTPRKGAKVASLNLLSTVPKAPPYSLAVALHQDVIAIGLGLQILDEALDLLGGGSKKPLAVSPRFKQAFAKLPAAEDEMVFFDMQAMLRPFRAIAELAVAEMAAHPEDTITNARFNEEANGLAEKGGEAYQQGDYKQALTYTKKAHDVAPTDSRIMYNLACFHAMVGDKNEALTWLEKAVDAGFYAPKHISRDTDLESIREEPQYKTALAKAKKKAATVGESAKWAAMVKTLIERLFDTVGMIDYTATVAYTEGYAVHTDEIAALVPGAEDRPFYPVFGKRKPLTDFDRYLPKETVSFSVCGGIDLGELYEFIQGTIRGMGSKGEVILATWAGMQQQLGVDFKKDVLGWIHGGMIWVKMKQPFGEQSVLMIKVTDEAVAREKLASALQYVSTNLQQAIQENPMLGMLAIRTSPATHEKLTGFHNVQIGMMPQPCVCGVTGGHLIVGTSADAVVLSLATAAGEHPNIRKNSRLMKEVMIPEGSFRSISFTDKRNLGTEIAEIIGGISMAGGMMTMMIPDPEAQQALGKILGMVAKLGPVVQKIDFYKSSSKYTTFDGKAWYTRSVTNYQSPAERSPSEGDS